MTRISDLGFQQLLLSGFQRAQEGAQSRQIQLSTGKQANTYGGIGPQTNQLLSAESVITRTTAFESAANVALSRLQIQESSITSISDAVADLRQTFVSSLANGTGDVIGPDLETAAQRILSSLNAQFGGVFVFGGTDGAQPPVAAGSLSDIASAADISALFAGGERTQLAVEEGVSVNGGPLAEEIGAQLLVELDDLANASTFQGTLTAAQRDLLIEKVAAFDVIVEELTQELGLNGVAQSQASEAITRGAAARDLAEIVASDIEDANLAEVVARLNQDQLAIQASAQALSTATQLSLLNFL